jgi:hypothetical protein
VVQRDADRHQLLGHVEQGGGRRLEPTLAEGYEHAGVDGLAQQALGVLGGEALAQLIPRVDLRVLGLEGLLDHLDGAEDLVRGAGRALHHPLDGGEVEALVLQLAHQLEPGDVLRAVVADPVAHGRGLQQPPGAVRADVAHREAGFGGQFLDRERVLGLLRGCLGTDHLQGALAHGESIPPIGVTSDGVSVGGAATGGPSDGAA